MNTRGLFIVLDGTDGSGKATQTELLREYIEKLGKRVVKVDFPRYTDNVIGKLIRECLDGKRGDFIHLDPKIASVLYAADRFETAPKIREWLESGVIVLSDRYVSANQIHQGGKIADVGERKDFLVWLDNVEYDVFGIPRPDVVVYLDVPVEVSMELIMKRAVERGVAPDQAESDAKHLTEAQASARDIIGSDPSWVRVDCAHAGTMRTREDIHTEIVAKLMAKLGHF